MSDDNELDINIRSLIDETSIQSSLQEIINLGKESAAAVQKAFDDAYIYQTEWASKSLLVTQEDVKNFQVAQKQKAQYYKEFTNGIAAEDKVYFNSLIAQQKETVAIQKQMYADELEAAITADKEMSASHAAALIENAARDRAYFDGLIAQEKEAVMIRKQMYLDSLGPPQPNNDSSGGGGLMSAASLARYAQFYAIYKGIQLVMSGISGTENFVKESVILSDKIRNTDAAIKAYSTSAAQATKTEDFFTAAMDRTRLTSLQLEQMYVAILPKGLQALGKESEDTLRRMTVDLANIGNLLPDVKPQDLANQATTLLGGGRFTGASALSKALGLNPDELAALKATNVNWRDDVIKLIHDVGEEGSKLGKSISAIWDQTKFSMMAAFAQGVLSARGNAISGMEDIRKVLTSPDFLNDLKRAGQIFAQGFTIAADVISLVLDDIRLQFNAVKLVLVSNLAVITTSLQGLVNVGYYLNKLDPFSTKDINKQWQDAKNSIDSVAAQWRKTTIETASNIADVTIKTGKDALKLAQDINNIDKNIHPSASFKIGPDVTDNPEAQTALATAAAAKQAKKDAATQRHKEALEKAAQAEKDRADRETERYKVELQQIEDINQRTTDQIKIVDDQVKKASDLYDVYKGKLTVAYDDYNLALDENEKSYNKNIAAIGKFSGSTQEERNRIAEVTEKINDLRDSLNELAKETLDAKVSGSLQNSTNIINTAIGKIDAAQTAADMAGMGRADTAILLQKRQEAKDQAKQYALDLKEAIKDQEVFETAAGTFVAGILGGSKAFSRSAAEEFKKLIESGTKNLLDDLMNAASGIKKNSDGTFSNASGVILDKTGKAVTDPAAALVLGGNASAMKAVNTALTLAQVGIGAYSQARQNPSGSVTAGVVGGFVAGFTTTGFNPYVAVAAAIVGGISAELGKAAARADYKYAAFNFLNIGSQNDSTNKNQVIGFSNDNITPAAFKKMLADVQNVVDTTYNNMAKIVIDFGKLIPDINLIGTGIGQIQPNPSGNFLANYDDWLSNTLPNALIGGFKDSLQAIAVNVGFSVKRFTSLWQEFSKLDPATQVQLWSDSLHAAQDIQTAMTWLHGDVAGDPGQSSARRHASNASTPYAGAWEQYQGQQKLPSATNPDYFTITQADRDNMLVIGKEVQGLTGSAQVAAAKNLSSLMNTYMTNSIAFMKALVDLSKTIHDTVTQRLVDLVAQGMTVPDTSAGAAPGAVLPDYKAQAEYYKKISDQDLLSLSGAKTPDAINAIWTKYQADIEKTASLQSQLGPADAESARQWLMAAYQQGQAYFDKAIQAAGAAVDKANAALVAELQPYIDAFTGALTGLTGAIGDATPYVAGHWQGNRFNRIWIPPVGNPNNPGGGTGKDPIDPINKAADAFTSLNSILSDFSIAVINATTALNNSSISTGNSVSTPNYRTQPLSIRQRAA